MSRALAQAEADQALHFAVAIERLRGWPVHATYVGETVVRYQAESSGDQVFDPRGIFTSERFSNMVVVPLVRLRRDWPSDALQNGQLRIGTKCLGEEGIAEAGLLDEAAIEQATALLQSNSVYLDLVPERPQPRLPAKTLALYSWSGCAVYAEALSRVTGLPAATMILDGLLDGHDLTGDRFHAVVVHPDGSVEDVWGRQPAEHVAQRYGMARWHFDPDAHRAMIGEAMRVRPSAVDDIAQAEAVILQHRDASAGQLSTLRPNAAPTPRHPQH
ncbi:hypothetical protein GCM10007886_01380 [Methylobacterium gregans]|uniref:hypothetical protein n=1 Tax=Methylobacterium gregans TaxID=374424 RepID=UPI00235BCFF5|nr:hypothetical protein [Methylobacterium gregans]GLS51956.1 hypothetical protein GCM10007886_01380 [Methylobacterium gregans]